MNDQFAVEVNTTKAQIEELRESIIWADICRELDIWLGEVTAHNKSLAGHIMDNNLNSGAALTLLGYDEGRKEAVDRFKRILDILELNLEAKKDDSRHDRANQQDGE